MRKYPSQEDCQLLVDAMNRPSLYSGACSTEFREFGEDLNAYPKNWLTMYDKCFGDNSPWDYKFNRNNTKRVLFWNKEKAKRLGI